MAPQPFDLWDQVLITEMTRTAVERVLNQTDRIANQFAPLDPTTEEKIGKGRIKLKALGKARGAIADDATPPIYRPEIRFLEEAYSLFRLSEMTPVEESLRRKLEIEGSDNESKSLRDRAGVDILTRIRALAVRQENLSDYYIMRAIQDGQLVVKVANPAGQDTMNEMVIDYEFPSGNIAVVSTSFADLINATPITYLRAWQEQLKRTAGEYGRHIWMSNDVFLMIQGSTQVRNSFHWTAPTNGPFIASAEMIKSLLHEPENVEFHITDAGWYDEIAGYNVENDLDKTRWIDADRVIMTTSNPFRGEQIAVMKDGLVPVQTGWNQVVYRQGAQTYSQLLEGNLTLQVRQEARRIPMIDHPECVVSAKVVL